MRRDMNPLLAACERGKEQLPVYFLRNPHSGDGSARLQGLPASRKMANRLQTRHCLFVKMSMDRTTCSTTQTRHTICQQGLSKQETKIK